MKKYISLFAALWISLLVSAQDKTPVLSEMGSLRSEPAQENPASLSEKDTVLVVNSEKRNRSRKMRKKAEISDAKKAEALDDE